MKTKQYRRLSFIGLIGIALQLATGCSDGGGGGSPSGYYNNPGMCPASRKNSACFLRSSCCDSNGALKSQDEACMKEFNENCSENTSSLALVAGATTALAATASGALTNSGKAEKPLGQHGTATSKLGSAAAVASNDLSGRGNLPITDSGNDLSKTNLNAGSSGNGAGGGGSNTSPGSGNGLTTAAAAPSAGSQPAANNLLSSASGVAGGGGRLDASGSNTAGLRGGFKSGGFNSGGGSQSGDTSTSEFARNGVAEDNPMKSEDPENYFTLTNLNDSIFKIVELQYRKQTIKWIATDAGTAAK